jgi:hypothetical protein
VYGFCQTSKYQLPPIGNKLEASMFCACAGGVAAELWETVTALDKDLQAAKARVADLEQQLAAATGIHGC